VLVVTDGYGVAALPQRLAAVYQALAS